MNKILNGRRGNESFLGSIEYDLILVFIGILLFRMVFLKLYMSEKERIIVENAPSSFS